MQVTRNSHDLRQALSQYKRVAFVPTMGNLHAGHLHLVALAKQHATCVVVSIFVNPLQFDSSQDLAQYPRTLEEDCKKLETAGATLVFAPEVQEMYPGFDGESLNQGMVISPPPIASELCGASRPGHFSGVATIVAKLFNMVKPDVAFFGKKDFQQLFIIRKLVNQFNFPIAIIAADIVREPGGLAMSSRNNRLSQSDRLKAQELHIALKEVVESIKMKLKDFSAIEKNAVQRLTDQGWDVDYISIRSPITLQPAMPDQEDFIVLGAATLNTVRLIDNIEFCAKPLN